MHCLTKHCACVEKEQVNFYMMHVCAINAIKSADSDILAGVRYHTANSEPSSTTPLTITQGSLELYQ